MDGLVALYFDAEPAHMRMIGKAAGDIAHHVLNKGRPRKGVFSHELLIFALEQRIDGRRAGRLGDLRKAHGCVLPGQDLQRLYGTGQNLDGSRHAALSFIP